MSDDKKNIFDSATVIMQAPKAKEPKVEAKPAAKPEKDEQTVTDFAILDQTETESVPSRFEKIKAFRPQKYPKLFGISAGLVAVAMIHFFMPQSENTDKAATPAPIAAAQAPVVPQKPIVQQTLVQPAVQAAPQVQTQTSRLPATNDFLSELESGMKRVAGK